MVLHILSLAHTRNAFSKDNESVASGGILTCRQVESFMRDINNRQEFKSGRMGLPDDSHQYSCEDSFSALTNAFTNPKYLDAFSPPAVVAFLY